MDEMWSQLDATIVGFFNPLAKDPAVRAPVRNGWPLQRLDHAVAIAGLYLSFVIGCKLMLDKGKKAAVKEKSAGKASVAQKIKQDGLMVFLAMVIYNATQVALCGWMVYAALAEHRRRGLSLVCNAHNLAEDGMAFVLHVFYLSKVLDFADTAFMIVKGNWRQVSFLHVYHHTSIFLVYWLNAQSFYDADIYFTIVLNGAIHFIMYGYYLATAFNVTVPMFIKKSITNAQLIQFCCMELQGACLLLGNCESPRNVTILYMVYISTMLVLFLDFKRRSYASNKASAKKNAQEESKKRAADLDDDLSTTASESEVVITTCCGVVEDKPLKRRKVLANKERPTPEKDVLMKDQDTTDSDADASPQAAHEVLIGKKLYDVRDFKHPGGSILKFFQGSGDATAAFSQFHVRSKRAYKRLAALKSRPAPPGHVIKGCEGKEDMEKDFQQLFSDLKAEGFFDPHMGEIFYRLSELVAIFALGLYFVLWCNSWAICASGIVLLGIAEGRCGWLMHEGGHGSLTGNLKVDKNLQILIYGLGCGMSAGWWRSQHNRHHATPQKIGSDPDLDTLPLVAFNAAVNKGIRNPVMKAWLKAQAVLFMPLSCCLVVLGWQLYLHPRYVIRTSKHTEMVSLLARYYLVFACAFSGWSWASAIGCYVLVQQIAGSYIFTNFAMSHTHLDVTYPDEHIHWCEYASVHTTNLSNHWFVNWWMAYLNFQIEHHMFPAMPQFRHPRTSLRVQALFQKHGLKYDTRGYFSCLGDTLRNLHKVGNQHDVATSTAKKGQ